MITQQIRHYIEYYERLNVMLLKINYFNTLFSISYYSIAKLLWMLSYKVRLIYDEHTFSSCVNPSSFTQWFLHFDALLLNGKPTYGCTSCALKIVKSN